MRLTFTDKQFGEALERGKAVHEAFERFYAIADKYDVDVSAVLRTSKTFFEGMREHSISASDYVEHVGASDIEAEIAEVCDDLANMVQ